MLRNSFAKFKEYAVRQTTKYNGWLKENREYFDTSKFPTDKSCSLQDAPDYRSAIMRIKEPLSNVIHGVPLDRIQVDDNMNSNESGSMDNKWFMQLLIKSYNGTGDDFKRFSKTYYYGEDKRQSLDNIKVAKLIPIMFSYCMNYLQTVHILENELQAVFMYLNQDPVSHAQGTSDNAERQFDAMNQAQQQNQMASTNPQRNVVNASVDYLAYRESVILNEYTSTASAGSIGNTATANGSAQAGQAPSVLGGGRPSNGNAAVKQQNPNTTLAKNMMAREKNQKQLMMKKKQTAFNIIRDCFEAKTTAAGMIYRDFITTLQVYLNGVQEFIRKNNKKQSKGK